jgi:hypothetical protein
MTSTPTGEVGPPMPAFPGIPPMQQPITEDTLPGGVPPAGTATKQTRK